MPEIIAIGVNHKTAPVEVRERVAFAGGRARQALEALRTRLGTECVLLSTCNRTEVYALARRPRAEAIVEFLAAAGHFQAPELEAHLYRHRGREAVRHLFRVASGIDSMLLGEHEILGQVRAALEMAERAETVGPLLGRLFRRALRAGKRARAETEISRGAFSVGGCAARLARCIFGDLSGARVIILGAGEMAEATARALAGNGAGSILVANRTRERAEKLARELGGSAIGYDQLADKMSQCQIVICSTAAPGAVLSRQEVSRVMQARRNAPLFLIDIAVPRDVEPSVGGLDNVYLYDIDDLSRMMEEEARQREGELARVEEIVHQTTEEYMRWYASLRAAPTISALRARAEAIRRAELERLAEQLSRLEPRDREAVEQLTAAIVNKLLHEPTVRLKEGLHGAEGEERIEALRELFGLEEEAAPKGDTGEPG